MPAYSHLAAILIGCTLLCSPASADDWPRFLGPNHNATSAETKLLKTCPATCPSNTAGSKSTSTPSLPSCARRSSRANSPLGGLLNRHHAHYRSEPRGYIRLAPDARLDAHFGLTGAHTLYGRSNVLLDDHGRTLARIVEVLRP